MIRAKLDDAFLIVIEPGNIDRLKGQIPIHIPIPEGSTSLIIMYSPDVPYVCELMESGMAMNDAITASLIRPEVHERPIEPPKEYYGVKVSDDNSKN
jgi:hypothetical protein